MLLEYVLRDDLVLPYVWCGHSPPLSWLPVRIGGHRGARADSISTPVATEVSLFYLECVGVVLRGGVGTGSGSRAVSR